MKKTFLLVFCILFLVGCDKANVQKISGTYTTELNSYDYTISTSNDIDFKFVINTDKGTIVTNVGGNGVVLDIENVCDLYLKEIILNYEK